MKRISKKTRALLGGGIAFLLVFTLPGYAVAQLCVPPPPGLVSWWPGDGDATDIAGVNDGTLQNGATFATGMVGDAFSFDGVDDHVNLPTTRRVTGQSAVSIDGWINRASENRGVIYFEGAGGNTLFNISVTADNKFAVGLRSDASPGGLEENEPTVFRSVNSLPQAGQWVHVAATVDLVNKSYKLYINGVDAGATGTDNTTQNSFVTTPNNVHIGIASFVPLSPVLESPFHGQVDELEIYHRMLSATEVLALFNAGSAGKCKGTGLDHFKCYKAKGDSVNVNVTLQDQFEADPRVRVSKPKLFCNPVDKNGEGIQDPTAHLTCYEIEHDHSAKRVVSVENQFGEQTLRVKKSELLCVPSKKLAVTVVPENNDDDEEDERKSNRR